MPDRPPPGIPERAAADDVAILLSTFNGSRFLRQQLDSFAVQDKVRWSLIWRDDGSTDGTLDVLRGFSGEQHSGRIQELVRPGGRLGITGSFMTLLRAAPRGQPVAFADQDDVWLPGKLERGLAALSAVPPGVPALYCARQRLVNSDLVPRGLSPHHGAPPPFPAALTQNVATGCTMMLNAEAAALVASTNPPPGALHDWWTYLVVSAHGGRLLADPAPAVLYRQHGGNAVGAPSSLLRRAAAALRRGPDAFMTLFRSHVGGLMAHPELLSPGAARDLAILHCALQGGPVMRLGVLRRMPGLIRQTTAETLLFRLWFLFG